MKVRQVSTIITTVIISLSLLYLSSTSVSANPIYNRYPWPSAYQGLQTEKENTDSLDANHTCNRTHGRSFQLSHTDSFKLEGISVYVYVDGEPTRFDRNLFRLSFATSTGDPLVTKVSPTHSAPVGLQNGRYTFEVYFPLNVTTSGGVPYTTFLECLTDETDTFRVAESSRVQDGLITGYYDSNVSQITNYYMEGRKTLFTTFTERGAPHFPAPAQNTNTGQTVSVPKFHPLVIVHGMGGNPSNFTDDSKGMNYKKMLTDLGYLDDFIHLYSYGYVDNGKGQVVYNYQGDVTKIAQGMEVVIANLSQKHKSLGGDGKVDVLAHSLGNLVTKQYLVTHKNNHNVRKYIAIGAPFKGSWIMDLDQGVRNIPGIGSSLEKESLGLVKYLATRLKRMNIEQQLMPSSPAAQQVRSDSSLLASLNAPGKFPQDVKVYTVYGDISASLEQKIFMKTFKKKVSLGDLVILPESASYFPEANKSEIAYSDTVTLKATVVKSNEAYAQVTWPGLDSLKYEHISMLTQPEVKSKIVEVLTNE